MTGDLPGNAGIPSSTNLVPLALSIIVFDQGIVHPQIVNGLSCLPSDFTLVAWNELC